MRQILAFLILTMAFTRLVEAYFIDTEWKIVGYAGEGWFVQPEQIIGQSQSFERGWAGGVFYSCDFAGQSMTYTEYSRDEFLQNKEFERFKTLQIELEEDVQVHRISCAGQSSDDRKIFYPFVTQGLSDTAFYLFEGAVYIMKKNISTR